MSLSTDLFDYQIPERLIAQKPADKRDKSRLLVVDRARHSIEHALFSDLPRFLKAGDRLFRNNAAVLPARLHAKRPSGGLVECFLLKKEEGQTGDCWRCLLRPGKRLPVGASFSHAEGAFSAEVLSKDENGTALVRFSTPGNEPLETVACRVGGIPLPPYIARDDENPLRQMDQERYQTVYANQTRKVAVAAPTAGLHFTPQLLHQLEESGVGFHDLTLHVGLGTFKPITAESIEQHEIHRELYELSTRTQEALLAPAGGRRIAVGTTSVRSIEDFLAKNAEAQARDFLGEAALFIYPPRTFRGVDGMITNFHQPRSTLLCLVSAFLSPGSTAGIQWLHEIYAEAIAREYRFFSYGDAMLIL